MPECSPCEWSSSIPRTPASGARFEHTPPLKAIGLHGTTWGLVVVRVIHGQPIAVALAQLAGGEAVKRNLPMAGALPAALPTLLVYIGFGRFFIRGLLAGSVKG